VDLLKLAVLARLLGPLARNRPPFLRLTARIQQEADTRKILSGPVAV
jgi:hypothetical protein